MANNQNKNNNTRLNTILSGIPAVICSIFLPFKRGRIIINSHFNCHFDFNSKYLFLYMLKDGYDVYFVINDDNYRQKLIEDYGNHFIETNSFRGKIFALRAKIWFVSAFEMPVGGIFLKIRHKIIHLTHGSLVKNVGTLEKDVSLIKKIYYFLCVKTNLSYSIATSDFFVPSTAAYTLLSKKKILVLGFPRNDVLFQENTNKPDVLKNCAFSVLYAPTWRKTEQTKLFPFDNIDFSELNVFLEKNDITLFVRLHPNDEKSIPVGMLQNRIKLFSSHDYEEINDYLSHFDSLITDYSSILYDFMLLDRPMLFLPYDYDMYEKNVGFAVDYNKVTPGAKPKTIEEFKQALVDMKQRDSFKEKRNEICDQCNKFRTGNSERIVEYFRKNGILK